MARFEFSEEEKQFIHAHYRELGSDRMKDEMEKTFGHYVSKFCLKRYRSEHGLLCDNNGQFEKGHVPFTKGKHPEEYCSPDALERMRGTYFRKGDGPHNTCPIGTIVLSTEGYFRIKVRDDLPQKWRNWKQLSHVIWEKANGPIPEGMEVMFLNGNRKDVRIENLALVDNRRRGYMRNFQVDDEEVQKLGLLIAEVKVRTEEPQKRRKKKNEEQL